jgi:glycosyltransferase involved in cell wall biosynthesis
MATGTPVVASSLANRGVGAVPGKELLVADRPGETAAAVLRLLDDPELRARLGHAGRALVERRFTWERHVQQLVELYERLVAGERRLESVS